MFVCSCVRSFVRVFVRSFVRSFFFFIFCHHHLRCAFAVPQIVALCERERIVLLADEVYQENVWAAGKTFISFKKVS